MFIWTDKRMAKKKEKRRSLLDKIRGLETETHPQGKRVGQLFQAVAAGEIEVSCCVLLFLEVCMSFYSEMTSVVWKSAVIGGSKGSTKDPPDPNVHFFFNVMQFFWMYPTFAVFHEGGVSPRDHYTIWQARFSQKKP